MPHSEDLIVTAGYLPTQEEVRVVASVDARANRNGFDVRRYRLKKADLQLGRESSPAHEVGERSEDVVERGRDHAALHEAHWIAEARLIGKANRKPALFGVHVQNLAAHVDKARRGNCERSILRRVRLEEGNERIGERRSVLRGRGG